jgi:uncharacterized protein YaaR (DUF327 family)
MANNPTCKVSIQLTSEAQKKSDLKTSIGLTVMSDEFISVLEFRDDFEDLMQKVVDHISENSKFPAFILGNPDYLERIEEIDGKIQDYEEKLLDDAQNDIDKASKDIDEEITKELAKPKTKPKNSRG